MDLAPSSAEVDPTDLDCLEAVPMDHLATEGPVATLEVALAEVVLEEAIAEEAGTHPN